MLSLIWKDVLLSKRMVPLILGYGIFMIILFDNSMKAGAAGFIATTVAVTYMMVTRAAAYDEIDKAELMILSLPISRLKVVMAKYLSVTVYALIGVGSYLLAMFLLSLFKTPIQVTPLNLGSVLGMLLSLVLLSSVYFPIYFKWGYQKSRIVNMFLFLAAFFLPTFFTSSLQRGEFEWLNRMGTHLQNQSDAVIIGDLLGICFILLLTSIVISLRFYHRREF